MKKHYLPIVVLAALLTSCSFLDHVSSSQKSTSNSSQSTGASTSNGTAQSIVSDGLTLTSAYSEATYSDLFKYASLYGAEAPLSSIGSERHLLVLPVNVYGSSTSYPYWTSKMLSDMNKCIFGAASDTGWQSLKSFYATSSYGALNLVGKVADAYTGASTYNISYIQSNGPDNLINDAIANYEANNTDYLDYDSDKDGYLDGVMVIYNVKDYSAVESLGDQFWAFTWSLGNKPNTSKPTGNKCFWASYDFMYEQYGTSQVDAHTFIHETGHMLGLDDYYSYDSQHNLTEIAPMGAIDMMDANIIDHNAFSKFALGWEDAQYVTGDSGSVTFTLKPAATTVDQCVLIPTSKGWNGTAFDEYLMLEYYTPTGLNQRDSEEAYDNGARGFTQNGIRIYHVDARLYDISDVTKDSEGYINGFKGSYVTRTGRDVVKGSTVKYGMYPAHSNSVYLSYVNSKYRLIQELDSSSAHLNFATSYHMATNATLFQKGETFSFSSYQSEFAGSTMNNGGTMDYKVKVNDCTNDGASITISIA
jgi:M6 family metalloprotease-like protein